jgi:hypothetical protein
MAAKALPLATEHHYHADANVFSAHLVQPIERKVKKQGLVDLPQVGGYEYQRVGPFQIEGLISYRSGYTQVAGTPSLKHGGFSTLSTSVIEGLNVIDVLTADRVVAQIFTDHPEEGQVPSVSFLGTRFENLQVAGHKIDLKHDLEILGPKPEKDRSYFEEKDVLNRVERQYSKMKGLPAWAKDDYDWRGAEAALRGKIQPGMSEMKCSLFDQVSGAPGVSFGHVIDLPFFGKIFLGELTVNRVLGKGKSSNGYREDDTYSFHLTMIRLKLGCSVTGDVSTNTADTNGVGKGGPTPAPPPSERKPKPA